MKEAHLAAREQQVCKDHAPHHDIDEGRYLNDGNDLANKSIQHSRELLNTGDQHPYLSPHVATVCPDIGHHFCTEVLIEKGANVASAFFHEGQLEENVVDDVNTIGVLAQSAEKVKLEMDGFEEPRKYIERQNHLFNQKLDELIKKYAGQYVLFHDGEVLYAGNSMAAVTKVAGEFRGSKNIFIKKVSKTSDNYGVFTPLPKE